MNRDDYIAALRSNASLLAAAARGTSMDTRVPSCPEWAVSDLLRHLGIHHRWVSGNLDRRPRDGMLPFQDVDRPPEGRSMIDWLETGADALASKLTTVDPASPCWTWTDDHTAGFWIRRTAHETTMHSWDGQNAAGKPTTIAAPFAADGIDEYLANIPFRFRTPQPQGDGETVHLHCTDTPGEWLVRLDSEGMRVTREHAKGDVAVRAPASDLLLVLCGRKSTEDVDVFGDAPLFDRFREQASF